MVVRLFYEESILMILKCGEVDKILLGVMNIKILKILKMEIFCGDV